MKHFTSSLNAVLTVIAFSFAITITSCQQDVELFEELPQVEEVTESSSSASADDEVWYCQTQEMNLLLSQSDYSVPNTGGKLEVVLTSGYSCDVEIPATCTWVSVSNHQNTGITFSIDKNTSFSNRQAEIVIRSQSDEICEVLYIKQAAQGGLFLDCRNLEVSSDGGSISVDIERNVEYDIEFSSNWISLPASTRGLARETVTLDIAANTDNSIREGYVIFRERGGNLADTLLVSQSSPIFLELPFTSFHVGPKGSQYKFNINTNAASWSVDMITGTVWNRARKIDGEIVLFVLGDNTGANIRTARMRVKAGDNVQEIILSQDGIEMDQFVPSQDTITVAHNASTARLKINTNITDWKATMLTATIWCRAKASETDLVLTLLSENTTGKPRSGRIRLVGGDVTTEVVIVQEGAAATSLRVEGSDISADYTGVTGKVNVETNDSSWSASVVEGSSWCTAKANGSVVEYSVSANSGAARSAVISVVAGSKEELITISQSAAPSLSLSANTFSVAATASTVSATISANMEWSASVTSGSAFCSMSTSGNTLKLTTTANSGTADRTATVEVVCGNLIQILTVVQKGAVLSTYYAEKEVLTLQKATVGKGIDIILMGDGFLKADLTRGGRYENIMKEAADHFFSIYPYSAYREYFNVYMVAATSTEEGVSGEFKATVNNRFGSKYWSGTSISCNETTVKTYAKVVPTYTSANTQTVIVVLNSKKYAGTCVMSKSGLSISLCPMPESSDYRRTFRAIVTHEAGGHGFPKLMDEYFTSGTTIGSSAVTTLKSWKSVGHAANIDFTEDKSSVSWSDFFNYSQYKKDVKVVKGGYTFQNGVWRCSDNSCMKDNSAYFNVVSRWAIVKKIHAMAGTSYSFDQFLKDDQIPAQTRSVVSDANFEQLGSPKLMD